uniref:Putative mitochondrial import inner membrane translocase subunit tim50 n=1 Tax=Ixodes ricinus TaxID=34613 RepID=A0A0K8R671_IXORI
MLLQLSSFVGTVSASSRPSVGFKPAECQFQVGIVSAPSWGKVVDNLVFIGVWCSSRGTVLDAFARTVSILFSRVLASRHIKC